MKEGALLAIDIGNSTIGLGFYPDAATSSGSVTEKRRLIQVASAASLERFISDFLFNSCRIPKPVIQPLGVAISSVVPELNCRIIKSVKRFSSAPLIITSATDTGLSLAVKHPENLGTDRIANALAGYARIKNPLSVIDLGTATTITVIGNRSRLLGGAIMPGLDMMIESLARCTSQLPLVAPSSPKSALGRDTKSAIISGIVNGTAAAIGGIHKGIEKELDAKLAIILTGGHAGLLSPLLKRKHLLIPDLIFEGIRLIYNRQN
ncbi:MAG TPA: type III pantothenate kinase [Dissulfurispiraceae bacterium]|nr:type III pantothenate kinase [Dissulfurispiraceae bacterium]